MVAADIACDTTYHMLVPPEEVVLGKSAAMSEIRSKLEKIACANVPVLVRGEAGSGKEILARLIHRRYPGETTPFHKVIPAGREGWRKSASVVVPREHSNGDGHHHHPRHYQNAPGKPACIGSLFFDEIAELNFVSQRKLTHLLKEGSLFGNHLSEFSSSPLRMICSTRHDIEREMRMGNFREDLFYSVNIVSLYLPPLRWRREDIPGLVEYLWGSYRNELGLDVPRPSPGLAEALQGHDWPGNIRELADVMKRYVLLGSEKKIADELAASAPQGYAGAGDVSLKSLARQEAHEIERKIIFSTLREAQWNRKRAARALNISYRTLLYKIKEAGLPPKRSVVKGEKKN